MSSSEQTNTNGDSSASSLDVLRQFARRRERRPPAEQCDLCSVEIPEEHQHLLEISNHALVCVCRPCSILFSDSGSGGGKYQLIPSRYLLLQDFHMTDEQWDNLAIPVNMVYMFHNTQAQRVMAFYPSPAGAMESLLSLDGWDELVSSNPILNDLTHDVEALLINRVRNMSGEYYREHYIVPIDACYQLVGLIRLNWKGLSGGQEVWKAIGEFFEGLRRKAIPIEESQADSRQGFFSTPSVILSMIKDDDRRSGGES